MMELTRERPLAGQGLLYPMMVIAAIAVIVFSVVGIATMTGWMPSGLLSESMELTRSESRDRNGLAPDAGRSTPTFECAECGVIETIREIDRRGANSVLFETVAYARR